MTNIEVSGSVPRFSRREIVRFAQAVLAALRKRGCIDFFAAEVSIAFVDDDAMRSLNRRFRRRNRTTDVLTFPADNSYSDPNRRGRPLGDIVISLDRARAQAVEEHHSLAAEVRHLILHGILHAAGYDHENDRGEMNALELDIRAAIGLE